MTHALTHKRIEAGRDWKGNGGWAEGLTHAANAYLEEQAAEVAPDELMTQRLAICTAAQKAETG